MKRKKEKYSS